MTPSNKTVNVAVRAEIGDLELVARHRDGDLDAFGEIYHRHAGRLYSLAYRMVGNAGDAEDLLQEIFMQAHRKLSSFKGESALVTWLYRLAMNHCLDHLRSKATRMSHATGSLDAEGAQTKNTTVEPTTRITNRASFGNWTRPTPLAI